MADINKSVRTATKNQICVTALDGPKYTDNPQDTLEFIISNTKHIEAAPEELSEISVILESAFKPILANSSMKNTKYTINIHIVHSLLPLINALPVIFESVVSLLIENELPLYDIPVLTVSDGICIVTMKKTGLITSVFSRTSENQ